MTFPPTTSWVLEFQVCIIMIGLFAAGEQTTGFMHAKHSLYPMSYNPHPHYWLIYRQQFNIYLKSLPAHVGEERVHNKLHDFAGAPVWHLLEVVFPIKGGSKGPTVGQRTASFQVVLYLKVSHSEWIRSISVADFVIPWAQFAFSCIALISLPSFTTWILF